MKNLFLIFGLAVAVFSKFPEANAMHTSAEEFNDRAPFLLVQVQSNPPVEILNLPSEKRVILDGALSGKSINLQCKHYNGVPMRAPLIVQYDMDDSTFLRNIAEAFGPVSCRYTIGSMSRNTLSQIFGFEV